MSDQDNRQLDFSNKRRAGGQLLLVFLLAAILIAGLAAVALADDGPGVVLDPDGEADKPTAEELQYRQILQGIMVPNAVINDVACMGNYGCNASDVLVATITNIVVSDACDGTVGDTYTFTADYTITANAGTRYDVGLWINTDNTGSAETGTQCSVSNLDIPPAYDGDGDLCGDVQSTSPVTTSITFEATCPQPAAGPAALPYCTAWDNNANTACNTPTEAKPSTGSKCSCDDSFALDNVVEIVKTAPDPVINEPSYPIFDYTIEVTNKGPLGATDLQVVDTLPPEVVYLDYDITYEGGAVDNGATCSHTAGVVTCGDGTPYLPVLEPNPPTDEKIIITITVRVKPDLDPGLVIDNTACVDWGPIDNRGHVCDNAEVTVPVTLTYFGATAGEGKTTFDWGTSSETANAGFNLYALVDGEHVRLNESLILSKVVDSSAPQEYSVALDDVQGTTFFIEDVPVRGAKRKHGPFELGEVYGAQEELQPIDWEAIQAEHEALAEERGALAAGVAIEKMEASKPNTLEKLTTWAQGIINSALGKKPPLKKQIAYPTFQLRVDQDGLYRLTYEELVAATGVGLAGVPAADLALTNSFGVAVPIYVGGGSTFGPGSYIEFYGQALDTLYTDTEVLKLSVDAVKAKRIPEVTMHVQRAGQAAPYYMETASFARDKRYSYLSNKPGDPWYDTLLLASKPKTWQFNMPVDNYVPAGGQGMLTMQIWGANDGNHHVKAQFNDQPVADLFFPDQDVMDYAGAVDLQEGANTLALTVPNDQGADFDMSRLEAFGLVYPRAFVARDDRLSFSGADDVFTVSNLSGTNAVVYRQENGAWEKLTQLKTEANGGMYSVSFAGSFAQADYHVATQTALLKPGVALDVAPEGLLDGKVDLLIIAHPSFIDGLGPLVAAREAQGYKVKVVNVEQVYTGYSGGVLDAAAIKSYIRDAIDAMGVQYILLVGGDTYDYRNFTNSGSMSFIPSLYAKTTDTVNFAPVDPLYTDIDFDNVPDAAIGRFPVRTLAELQLMIDKTFQYEAKGYQETAVFAADSGFAAFSEDFSGALQPTWSVEKAYLGQSDVAAAKETLINSLNDGVALASFVGHSSRSNWTFDGLLKTKDVAALTNYGEAAIVSQWGCWNTYYVDPAYNTLGHVFLLTGTNGASAVTGSTTITDIFSEYKLGQLLMPRLVEPGTTVGEAMQAAKTELAQSHPDYVDVLLGWTILGDPTTMVQP